MKHYFMRFYNAMTKALWPRLLSAITHVSAGARALLSAGVFDILK